MRVLTRKLLSLGVLLTLATLSSGCFNAQRWYGEAVAGPPRACEKPDHVDKLVHDIETRGPALVKDLSPGQVEQLAKNCDVRVFTALVRAGLAPAARYAVRILGAAREEREGHRPLGELVAQAMASAPPRPVKPRRAVLDVAFVWSDLLYVSNFGARPSDRWLFERAEAIAKARGVVLEDPFKQAITQGNAAAVTTLASWGRTPTGPVWDWIESATCADTETPRCRFFDAKFGRTKDVAVHGGVAGAALAAGFRPRPSLCLGVPGFAEHARALMRAGVDPAKEAPDCPRRFGGTLHRVLYTHDFALALELVEKGTPLYRDSVAASLWRGPEELALAVLARGASATHAWDDDRCVVPLAQAVSRRFSRVTKELLAHGANPNQPTCKGPSAHDLAIATGDAHLIAALEAAGGQPTPPEELRARVARYEQEQRVKREREAREAREEEERRREAREERLRREEAESARVADEQARANAEREAQDADNARTAAEMRAAQARNPSPFSLGGPSRPPSPAFRPAPPLPPSTRPPAPSPRAPSAPPPRAGAGGEDARRAQRERDAADARRRADDDRRARDAQARKPAPPKYDPTCDNYNAATQRASSAKFACRAECDKKFGERGAMTCAERSGARNAGGGSAADAMKRNGEWAAAHAKCVSELRPQLDPCLSACDRAHAPPPRPSACRAGGGGNGAAGN